MRNTLKRHQLPLMAALLLALAAAMPGAQAHCGSCGAGESHDAKDKEKKHEHKMAEEAPQGDVAPGFSLENHDGETVSLADYAGKIVVLEFVNPQCPFVVRHYELGTMKQLAEKYAEKDVVWLAVNSTNFLGNSDNAEWAEKHDIGYPILNDSAGEVGHAYGARTTPHMIVIDAEGKIAYDGAIDSQRAANGPIAEDTVNYVAQALDALLAGEAVAQAKTQPYGCSVKYKKD